MKTFFLVLILAQVIADMREIEGPAAAISPEEALVVAAAIAFEVPEDLQGVMLALAYQESRFRPLVGDQGRSCGPWQQQAQFSPGYAGSYTARARRVPAEVCGLVPSTSREEECGRLLQDASYAACIAVRTYEAVGRCPAAYNAGVAGARRGRGGGYADRVRGLTGVARAFTAQRQNAIGVQVARL